MQDVSSTVHRFWLPIPSVRLAMLAIVTVTIIKICAAKSIISGLLNETLVCEIESTISDVRFSDPAILTIWISNPVNKTLLDTAPNSCS